MDKLQSAWICLLASGMLAVLTTTCGGIGDPRQDGSSAGASGSGAGAAAREPSLNGAVVTDVWASGGADATGGVASGGLGGSSGWAVTGGGVAAGAGPQAAVTAGATSLDRDSGGAGGTGSSADRSGGAVGTASRVSATGGQASVEQPAGSIGAYEVGCENSADCQASSGCLFHPAATRGVCFPYCDSISDCPNPHGACVNLGSAGLSYCMPNCDPRDPHNDAPPFAACGLGAGCALDAENSASYCTAESNPAGVHGAFCASSIDCAVGYTCVGFSCASYCLVGAGDCDDLPRTACSELVQLRSGEAFGYCAGGTYVAHDLPLRIFDLSTTGSVITVGDDLVVSRVMVQVSIQHSYCGDLRLALVGPDGSEVLLSQANGALAVDCYSQTYFDDSAPTGIDQAIAPYQGAFRPQQSLVALAGLGARGDWSLVVHDESSGDEGELVGWTLTLW
jgi:subtilisin-like proprotein convertase family protein